MALPEPNIQVFPFEPLKYMYGYESYIENLKLVPKGKELEYTRNLEFVKIIDLSNNNLSGSIPAEICVLFEFVSKSFDGKDTRKNWEHERVGVN